MMRPRRAIVTGGTRGIGAAIVRRLCDDGFDVIATYRTNDAAAARLCAAVGERLTTRAVEGSDASAISRFVAELADKPVDLLVNNAGVAHSGLVSRAAADEVDAVFRVNLYQAFYFTSALLPAMMRRRAGDIVMISSLASGNVRPGNAFYGASKAALERYALGVAQEAARFDVAVNVVAPGYVRTELSNDVLSQAGERELRASLPARRLTETSEIADTVAWLAQRKPMLFGAILPVGGGGQL